MNSLMSIALSFSLAFAVSVCFSRFGLAGGTGPAFAGGGNPRISAAFVVKPVVTAGPTACPQVAEPVTQELFTVPAGFVAELKTMGYGGGLTQGSGTNTPYWACVLLDGEPLECFSGTGVNSALLGPLPAGSKLSAFFPTLFDPTNPGCSVGMVTPGHIEVFGTLYRK